jgi:DNA-binding transcriptional LysR family regulator
MELLNREILILKLLVAEKSITKTAERAGVQQPAVSKILNQIEQKLERKLFLRTPAGLKPTPFAIELSHMASEAQIKWDNSVTHLLEKEKRIEGTYSLGCHPMLAKIYLTAAYPKLINEHPHLMLNLVLEPSKTITQKVIDGELNFGIVANPIRQPELVIKSISQEAVSLYQCGKLESHSTIYYNPDMLDITRVLRSLKGYKHVSIRDYQLILSLVASKKGQAAILPNTLAEKEPSLSIASKPYFKTEIKLIYRKDLQKTPAVEAILKELKSLTP